MTVGPDSPRHTTIFSAFLKIGLIGFGGVAAFARHVLVVEQHLLDDADFAQSFSVASTLPGANTVNLAAMLGDRWRGPTGSMAAVCGLMLAPAGVLVGVMALYVRFGALPDVRAALGGAAAAAAGLVVGTSIKLLLALKPSVWGVAIFLAVCLAAGVVRVPMPAILALALPISVMLALWRDAC